MTQVRTAEGCLRAEAKTIAGVQHTLSVWVDRKAMLNFMMVGAHRDAMRDFRKMAEGSTYGFEAETVPDWQEARRLWQEKGRAY